MATIPGVSHALITVPFSHHTDFTELASYCDVITQALIACDNPIEKLALCGRLSACLTLLQPTLNEPIPEHLIPYFTLSDLPSRLPVFEPESDQLGHYCQTIAQVLMSRALPPEQTRVMEDLLGELVSYYADVLNAPRWITTTGGVVELN